MIRSGGPGIDHMPEEHGEADEKGHAQQVLDAFNVLVEIHHGMNL
jgi:hypothetical protein